MNDFITWLKDAFDAAEQKILVGWDSDGTAQVASMWTGGTPGYTTVATGRPGGVWIADGRAVTDARSVLVLWDPRQELAAIAVDRAILAEHQRDESNGECVTCCVDGSYAQQDWPCTTVRLVASRYATWPGYQPEWAPEGSRG
ncbi:DUF6221 family protein [Micromonospora chalcea]|uniref:DUF6221 family protein n=1 Tax=Micromonospora chalcea TaxID=1874 RepID=UPI00380CF6C7